MGILTQEGNPSPICATLVNSVFPYQPCLILQFLPIYFFQIFFAPVENFNVLNVIVKFHFHFRFFDMLEQKKSVHVAPILKSLLCWLPLKERIKFKILLVTYKILHGFALIYSNELLFNYTPHRLLRSSSVNLLSIPKTRTRLPMGRQILLSDCTKVLE